MEAVDFLSQVLDSPELEAVRDAVQNLQDIGESLTTTYVCMCHICLTLYVKCRIKLPMFTSVGVLDKTESLTPLGERIACMSCDPRLGKVLVLSAMFRCVLPMLSVAACLTRDPFYNSLQNRAQVNKVKCFNTHPVDACSFKMTTQYEV